MKNVTLDQVLDYTFFQTKGSLRSLLEKKAKMNSEGRSPDSLVGIIIIQCMSSPMDTLIEEAIKAHGIVEKDDVTDMRRQIGDWLGKIIKRNIESSTLAPKEISVDPNYSQVTTDPAELEPLVSEAGAKAPDLDDRAWGGFNNEPWIGGTDTPGGLPNKTPEERVADLIKEEGNHNATYGSLMEEHGDWEKIVDKPVPDAPENTPAKPLSRVRAINWNIVPDPVDLKVWNRAWENFWLPEKISLSNDLPTWRLMTRAEQLRTIRVFTGLTLLDTMQYEEGLPSIMDEVQTQHEAAVLSQFQAMEAVHARSYSSIFSTLCTSLEIEEAYIWSEQSETLQYKAQLLTSKFRGETPLKRKIASILLEMFLFYSGFFWPLYLSANGKIPNSGDIIKLIIR